MSKHADRAKQFMPFAALTGFYPLVREREYISAPRRERTEEENIELSQKTMLLHKGMVIKIKHYRNDGYESIEGTVSNVDTVNRFITVEKNKILFDDIYEIEIQTDG